MTCRANLFNAQNNKVLKTKSITRDTYLLCEIEIQKLNETIKHPKYWKITEINI